MFTDREATFVRWYDYLWLLIPIAGVAIMVVTVTERAARNTK